ncbi:ribosomal protein L16 [Plasmodium brasilianum]|uniref:50S ribosomal protein L16 n=2 Tax=Plasmodium (Plasmodium) TaxID=418103 RepID=A0A1A8X3D7_PLAMA|nr:mitochondrial ribosomal protein L16 precursor, putative [Plasmodium malariae]KAI4835956.1 ribosomal protein L16 [Plasmodium brasilianum]SBS99736.1 50S ribosomal protein L16 [Plasmodium malariae]SBT72558.1 mitochondrial ribosomal protein L16 precursor, putative [Plasmodium malariae]SCP02892.1 mitochondrial ribosomal protein L16 precursor, putative [Plasmodium malariae]
MPPIIYKSPLPVRLKAPKGRITPLSAPDIHVGKSLVAACPKRIRGEKLAEMKQIIRKYLGKKKEYFVDVHATYSVTKKPDGTKMGQGKGLIDYFVARVPAGKTIFHIPTTSPFNALGFDDPIYKVLKKAAAKVAIPCVFRTQNNLFRVHNIKYISQKKILKDQLIQFNQYRSKLFTKDDNNT